MADATLVNHYKQYKDGTTRLVNWLANAARGCQDVSNIVPSLRAARDAAKQVKQAKKKQKSSVAPADTKVTLTTSQLLSLAQIVVKAAQVVPEAILQTVKDVIAERQIYADWYIKCTDPADWAQHKQNSGHRHFIEVLREILNLLQAAPKGSPLPTKASKRPQKKKEQTVSNIFSHLTIEEPVENALGSAPLPQHAAGTTNTASKVQFELEETEEDANFAVWCLLHDMRELRREVRDLWMDYRKGNISFSAVTEMTANAFVMIEFADCEFVHQYPELWSYQSIMRHLGLQIGAYGPNVWLCPNSTDGVADVSKGRICGDAVVDLLCPRAFIIFEEFVIALFARLGKTALKQHCPVELLNIHPFGRAISALLPDLDSEKFEKLQGMHEDPLLKAARSMAEDEDLAAPIALIMVCQMQMDLHDIMRSDFTSEIQESRSGLAANIATLTDFSTTSPRPRSPTSNKAINKRCLSLLRGFHEAAGVPLLGRVGNSKSNDNHPETAPIDLATSRLYQVFPVVPGVLMGISTRGIHSFGMTLCNHNGVVLSVAYLYRAARRVGAIQSQWDDMEFVVKIQSRKRPFVLESEAGSGSMAKCFGLALGVKLQQYAKGRDAPLSKQDHIEQNARKLVDWPSLHGTTSYKFSGEYIPPEANGSKLDMAIHSLNELEQVDLKNAGLEEMFQRYKSGGKITLVQLFSTIKKMYMLDEIDLKFDYVGFYLACERILGNAFTTCNLSLSRLHNKRDFDMAVTYEVVYAILCDTAEHSKGPSTSQSSTLHDVGAAMEQSIKSEGKYFSTLSRSQSSGDLKGRSAITSAEGTDEQPDHENVMSEVIKLLREIGLYPEEPGHANGVFYDSRGLSEAWISAQRTTMKAIDGVDEVSEEDAFEQSTIS